MCCGQSSKEASKRRGGSFGKGCHCHAFGGNAASVSISPDPEKCIAGFEHVILRVQGLARSGRESELSRSLNSLLYIHNTSTSLALSLVEFDLDLSAGSVEGVIRAIKRTTGFECESVPAVKVAASEEKRETQELEV